ncbi:MAG: LAGLIDADG family homing endonuclease [Candidatus Staskawiczbacteria bacterium]|nr:LAGLIDADG family homing endonuclease [Candidatus Staskawiczbacteria bacterium]
MNKKINQDFFKIWSAEMAYVLGFIVADGSIIKRNTGINSYIFNITSKDKDILEKIQDILGSSYRIGIKYNSLKMPYNQIQVCNLEICDDLMKLGIHPRKTYNLEPIKVPKKYFSDYVRGFFDGDGTVYIQKVNGTLQIKSGFVAVSSSFIEDFNKRLCASLHIPEKSVHEQIDKKGERITQYNISFYIDDSEKLAKFMYGNNSTLYLDRKKKIFDQWKLIKRRHYKKENYPSKIGWHLNEKALN